MSHIDRKAGITETEQMGPETPAKKTGMSRPWAKPVMAAVILLVLVGLSRILPINEWVRYVLDWVDGLGAIGPLLLVAVYIAATVFLVPGSLLTLGAGFVFGLVQGTIVASIGSTLGATAAFLVGRFVARDWTARKIEGNRRFEAIDKAIAREGWKIVGLTRLSPVFPFVFLNYAFSVTRVSLKGYFFASWVGMLPGTLLYVYVGTLGSDLATLGAGERARTPFEWALYVLGLIATIAVTVYITRLARNALHERVDLPEPPEEVST